MTLATGASRRGRRSDFFPLIQQRPRSDRWPEPDRRAWLAAISPPAGPFDAPGPAAHLSEASRRIREGAYGSYLAWLEAEGLLQSTASPAERFCPEWVAGWLAVVCGRTNAKTAAAMLVNLSLTIKAMMSGRDWRWMRRLPGRPTSVAIRASSRREADPPDTIQLAVDALAGCEALARRDISLETAVEYRDLLIVALACYHAPRLRNLAELRIGTHLVKVSEGIWRLDCRKTKNGNALPPRLGAGLVPSLERYLSLYRPLLLGQQADHGFLWLNRRRLPLASTAFRGVFARIGLKLVGRPLHPHIVRHGMATALLRRDPRSLATAAAALGHHSTSSVNQVYDRSGGSIAAAEWSRVLKAVMPMGG
jgi:integrase/recombinase XerD